MTTDEPTPHGVGRRIHELRALRGLSLAELGARAHVSAAMLSYIERGERTPSEQVVSAVARALHVTVSVLHGQPYIEQLRQDQLDKLIAPIAGALDAWDVPPDDADPPPRGLDALTAEVMHLQKLRNDGDFGRLAELVPALLREISAAVLEHTSPGRAREQSHWLQSEVAATAFVVARRFGHMDLARLSLARMASAARESGDPRQVASERVKRVLMLWDGPNFDAGLRLVNQTLRDLDDDGTRATRAVRGGTMLMGAVLQGLRGAEDDADAWLVEAQGWADELGETNDYLFLFGPTNAAIHAMRSAAARDQHDRALKVARKVRVPKGYAKAKGSEYWVHTAESLAVTAQADQALEALERAKELAPQQARYHPTVRETVGTLLRARSRPSDRLRAYAAWSGV